MKTRNFEGNAEYKAPRMRLIRLNLVRPVLQGSFEYGEIGAAGLYMSDDDDNYGSY